LGDPLLRIAAHLKLGAQLLWIGLGSCMDASLCAQDDGRYLAFSGLVAALYPSSSAGLFLLALML
jgi:hypothetical protein